MKTWRDNPNIWATTNAEGSALRKAARDVVLQEGRYPPTKNTRELAETFKSLVVVPKAALRRLEAALAAPTRRDMRPVHVITEEHRALERLPALLDAIETMDQKITPYGDDRPDGDAYTYIVKAETWHRVLAAARSRRHDRPHSNSSAPMTEPVPEGDIVTIEINQEQPEEKVETTETTETETETTETITEKPADEDEDEDE